MFEFGCAIAALFVIALFEARMDRRNEKDRLGKGRKANTIKDDPNSDDFLPW